MKCALLGYPETSIEIATIRCVASQKSAVLFQA
jgi:hypothetical protein